MTDAPSLALPPTPQPQARQWREAFARLSAQTPPCPGINLKKWPEMHTVALQFLSDHADRAAELGFKQSIKTWLYAVVYLRPRNDRIASTTTIAPIIQMMLFIRQASVDLH